jgi:DNA-binding NarL/FixJ family response regulator
MRAAIGQAVHEGTMHRVPDSRPSSVTSTRPGPSICSERTVALRRTPRRNAEIAKKRLHRSVRTVDHHVAAALVKLGVDSRVAAIQVAQRAGLVAQIGQPAAPN